MIEGQSCCFTTDRLLVLGGPVRPVRRGSEDLDVSGQDLPSLGAYWNDRTLGVQRPITCVGASGHVMTVEIR